MCRRSGVQILGVSDHSLGPCWVLGLKHPITFFVHLPFSLTFLLVANPLGYSFILFLPQFEQDIHKVQAAHDMIIESTRKREQLETRIRSKLEADKQQLNEQVMLLQGKS